MIARAAQTSAMLLPKGRLAENVLHFVRVLRATGLPVGPAKVIDAIAAVEGGGCGQQDRLPRGARDRTGIAPRASRDIRAGLRHILAQSKAAGENGRRVAAARLCHIGDEQEAPELPARLAQAMLPRRDPDARPDDEEEVDVDAAFTFSAREILQEKDFATMTADELGTSEGKCSRSSSCRWPNGHCGAPGLPVAVRASICARRCAA